MHIQAQPLPPTNYQHGPPHGEVPVSSPATDAARARPYRQPRATRSAPDSADWQRLAAYHVPFIIYKYGAPTGATMARLRVP
eukprot:316285-Chlamydomonas_euryale.AAC.2